ncbi:WecB/TagA/CpsF family glycosyltransferase [Rhizobium sp. CC-YZS058]|uniref:WecB/TagA/CpsF family glycosyltransferase n=1 Tax=Rhizobium sp. CC-YZS058 TaxID=3042153 RepID=UPI002B05C6FB|nr:WecB/TagA/CpsF family glycosyltransferase [Rhizobium sp. CC-YZS058]MEA3537434.1 WecB/TagA/CpsF family glycosyltransferase [Rhizobium sp. CC-YZS058]
MTLVSYNLSVPASRERSDFLNAPFDPLAFEEVLERIRTIDETSPFKYIVTPNVDHVVRLNRDSSLREYYSKAWLSLCDSAPISAFALLLWVDLPIVTGSDLTEAMFREVIRDGDRVTLIVANQQVADRAMQTFPHVSFRTMVPPQNLACNPDAMEACIDFIACEPSRFTFIAVGSPQSERIACGLTTHPEARGLAVCCGASIEFLVGMQKRAPHVLRGSGFEWLFRMANDPRRLFKRYASTVAPLLRLMGAEVVKTVRGRR